MPMNDKELLSTERNKLELINNRFFELLEERRNCVSNITSHKIKLNNYSSEMGLFDVSREKELFARLKDSIKGLSLKELFAFSLIIESQVNNKADYPKWSEKIHLFDSQSIDLSVKLHYQINPVLLFFYNSNLFKELNFTKSFRELLVPFLN